LKVLGNLKGGGRIKVRAPSFNMISAQNNSALQ
jgi:hypothetical protein